MSTTKRMRAFLKRTVLDTFKRNKDLLPELIPAHSSRIEKWFQVELAYQLILRDATSRLEQQVRVRKKTKYKNVFGKEKKNKKCNQVDLVFNKPWNKNQDEYCGAVELKVCPMDTSSGVKNVIKDANKFWHINEGDWHYRSVTCICLYAPRMDENQNTVVINKYEKERIDVLLGHNGKYAEFIPASKKTCGYACLMLHWEELSTDRWNLSCYRKWFSSLVADAKKSGAKGCFENLVMPQ